MTLLCASTLAVLVNPSARADDPSVVTLDVPSLRATALAGNPVTIPWGNGRSYTLILSPSQVLADDATHSILNADGTETPAPAPTAVAFAGYVEGQSATTSARITMTLTWISGYVLFHDGSRWDWIEPIAYPTTDGRHTTYDAYDAARPLQDMTHLHPATAPKNTVFEPRGGTENHCVVDLISLLCNNRAPNTPPQPSGPSSGLTGQSLQFCTQGTSDPDGDPVFIVFIWGDGTTSSQNPSTPGSSVCNSHSYSSSGTKSVRARAEDNRGGVSSESTSWNVQIQGGNPPNAPGQPSGASSGTTADTLQYCVSATDPDGQNVKYTFDWNDNSGLQETGFGGSGWTGCLSHRWFSAGTYNVRAFTTDSTGLTSGWSLSKTVVISVPPPSNRAPTTPNAPTGPSSLNRNQQGTYTASASDIDGDQVRYEFDWGQGGATEFTGFVNSGQSASLPHSWPNAGTFCVRARAHDNRAPPLMSSWSDCRNVVVVNRAPNQATQPTGSTSISPGSTTAYTTSATDPDGDVLTYQFDWGDGSLSPWGAATQSHSWSGHGHFDVRARAQDTAGTTGPWSTPLTILVNRAPAAPAQPTGPKYGLQNHWYELGTRTTDPDGDNIFYRFFLGTQTVESATTGSGQPGSAFLQYTSLGSQLASSRAVDDFGAVGSLSSSHGVFIKASRITVRIAAYPDQSWSDRYGTDASNRVVAMMNVVNGATARASGSAGPNPDMDYEVAFTTIMNGASSPNSSDCETYIGQMRDRIHRQSSTHREINVGFAHRTWQPPSGSGTVFGCAFQDQYGDDEYMYSVATTRTASGGTWADADAGLLWTHELGHQMGGHHDNAVCTSAFFHNHCTIMASGVSNMHTHNEWSQAEFDRMRPLAADTLFGKSVAPDGATVTHTSSGRTATLTLSSWDYDDTFVSFRVNWDDGTVEWTPWINRIDSTTFSHTYGSSGCRTVSVSVEDTRGETNRFTTTRSVCV